MSSPNAVVVFFDVLPYNLDVTNNAMLYSAHS